jgi:hypothetical protein
MSTMHARLLVFGFVAMLGCKDKASDEPKLRSAAVTPSLNPNVAPPPVPQEDKTPAKVEDTKKGDKSDEEWVPAEFKTGAARWKDTGVYLDGKPIAFLTWGELPIGLKPTWIVDKVSQPKRAGTKDLDWRWGQQRRYRFTDYLTALGVDVKKVKELHVYGPRFSNSVVATTKDLLSPQAKDFQFRFGGNTFGKAIPAVPPGFAHGKVPDKLAALMIYIEKKPPTLGPEGFDLDGVPQEAVPYYGEPLRGGIRVYLDNRLAAIIKRQELDPKKATKTADGELEWKFGDFLTGQGVDTSHVEELWVVQNENRTDKLPGGDIANMKFQASAQAKGGVLLIDGDKRVRANAIALHTKPVDPKDMPFTTPDDD